MERQAPTRGTCKLCGQVIAKSGMTRHLKSCLKTVDAESAAAKGVSLFHLVVEGSEEPEYWLHLEVKAKARLSTLDKFLRAIWLECCGHLSAFEIGGMRFESYPDFEYMDEPGADMSCVCQRALDVGTRFSYEYDYGSTTYLKLKVAGKRQGRIPGSKSVRVLARNEPPDITCCECHVPAALICTECMWGGETSGCICEEHAKEHECGSDCFLPIVNSPRVGVCGYTG